MFADRFEAGRRLAHHLDHLKDERPLVIALPRGGVPVGQEVARSLQAPLDILVVRKIGAPGQHELALGAVGPGGETVWDERTLKGFDLSREDLETRAGQARKEIIARMKNLGRHDETTPDVKDRTVILVDDGIATGSTAHAALRVLRRQNPRRLVLAVPVVARGSLSALLGVADEIVYIDAPEPFMAVGQWYRDFDQVRDEEVRRILMETQEQEHVEGPRPSTTQTTTTETDAEIPFDDMRLRARVTIPPGARGIVLFAHGAGSGRDSPRNQRVARTFNDQGLATVLMDLLTPREQAERAGEGGDFDRGWFEQLADRLGPACRWARSLTGAHDFHVGVIGSSTGAAVALLTAARYPELVQAVVSRGGRPELAGEALGRVRAPTLLIVGENDVGVLRLNEDAQGALECENRLHVIRGATHLFEETGTLDEAAQQAADWFLRHLQVPPTVPVHGSP